MGLMPLLQRYVLPLMQARAGQRPASSPSAAAGSAPGTPCRRSSSASQRMVKLQYYTKCTSVHSGVEYNL